LQKSLSGWRLRFAHRPPRPPAARDSPQDPRACPPKKNNNISKYASAYDIFILIRENQLKAQNAHERSDFIKMMQEVAHGIVGF